MPLAGRPLVEWSLLALREAEAVGPIVVACPPGRGRSSARIPGRTTTAPGDGGAWEGVRTVAGGETRARSVANALALVETELVAIHDAARPLLTPELLGDVVAALLADPEADGAIAAAPVTDTIKRAAPRPAPSRPASKADSADDAAPGATGGARDAIEIEATVDRGELWRAQTPQVFRVGALREALAGDPAALAGATDEAMMVEANGGKVLICPAPAENIKVTTPLDLRLAGLLLAERR